MLFLLMFYYKSSYFSSLGKCFLSLVTEWMVQWGKWLFPGLIGVHSQVLLLKSEFSQKGKSVGTILNHYEELDFPDTS